MFRAFAPDRRRRSSFGNVDWRNGRPRSRPRFCGRFSGAFPLEPAQFLLQSTHYVRIRQDLYIDVGIGGAVARKMRRARSRDSGADSCSEGFPGFHFSGGRIHPENSCVLLNATGGCKPPPVSTPARVPSGKRRIIIRLPAQARGISEPRISNSDKVGSLQPSGQNRFKSPDRARLGEAYRRFPERRFQSINAVAAEKLADVGNSATVYSVLVEVEW